MKTVKKTKILNDLKVLSEMEFLGHEQILFCQDKETSLKAIIAIHDTTLGPALGGTRMWNYDNDFGKGPVPAGSLKRPYIRFAYYYKTQELTGFTYKNCSLPILKEYLYDEV